MGCVASHTAPHGVYISKESAREGIQRYVSQELVKKPNFVEREKKIMQAMQQMERLDLVEESHAAKKAYHRRHVTTSLNRLASMSALEASQFATQLEGLLAELLETIRSLEQLGDPPIEAKRRYVRLGAQFLREEELAKALQIAEKWGLADVARDAYKERRGIEKDTLLTVITETTLGRNFSPQAKVSRQNLWKKLDYAIGTVRASELPKSSAFYMDVDLEEAKNYQKEATCPTCMGAGQKSCTSDQGDGVENQGAASENEEEGLNNATARLLFRAKGLHVCAGCCGTGLTPSTTAMSTFVVMLSASIPDSKGSVKVTCHNLSGAELACLDLHVDDEAPESFRQRIARCVFTDGAVLEVLLPSGGRLERGEVRTMRELLCLDKTSI